MEIIDNFLNGVMLLKPKVFFDERGFFFESYKKNLMQELSIDVDFVQDNISKSAKGTIRGLHYQVNEFAQAKLCQVMYGNVLDVAVDIRVGSPTYGKYQAFELNSENKHLVFIPPGFAHGFSVLSDFAVFSYKCSAYYNKASERAIRFDDPDLNISWGVDAPILSEKDKLSSWFKEIDKDFLYSIKE